MIMIQSARLSEREAARDRRSSSSGAAAPRKDQSAKPAPTPWLPLGRYEWHAGGADRRPPTAV